jgi:hypothetical protein
MQKEMQQMMKDMFNNFDQYMMHFPVIMPVVVVPQEGTPTPTKKAPLPSVPTKPVSPENKK